VQYALAEGFGGEGGVLLPPLLPPLLLPPLLWLVEA
jgi:hypothetical protein